jgi:hypothetical protein
VAAYLDAVLNPMSGDELYELRWGANLSQAEFAAPLGVSQPRMASWWKPGPASARRNVRPEGVVPDACWVRALVSRFPSRQDMLSPEEEKLAALSLCSAELA